MTHTEFKHKRWAGSTSSRWTVVKDRFGERRRADSEEEKPHRAVGSPALCGLKLLCEFSQARAGKGSRKREEGISKVKLLLSRRNASVLIPQRTLCIQ